MAVDRIKHTKPASQRTFLDELEPIPYEITEEELASLDPQMKKVLFGIEEQEEPEERHPEETPAEAMADESVAEEQPAEPAPEPEQQEVFDPATIADFPPHEGHSITVIFPQLEGFEEAESAAGSVAENRVEEIGGRLWFAARYGADEAIELKRLNELLGQRDDVVVLVDGKRPPYGRTLWLPLMYIFTASAED
ncbi:MAG TPA: hypothetical protein VMX35_13670 [Acidobacteriota bacterium]|nr:hypothetical protein [Acidobacteriota bacterium]